MKLKILAVFAAGLMFYAMGCASSNPATPAPASTATPIPTATQTATPRLVAFVTLRNSSTINAQRTPSPSRFYDLQLSDNNTPVLNADFRVNATPVPYTNTSGNYGQYRMYNVSATPGVTYNVSVYYKEVTLLASMVMPGNQNLNPAGDQINWTYGTGASVAVKNSAGTVTYSAIMNSTPHSIVTATAYPVSDTYTLDSIITYEVSFTGSALPYLAGSSVLADEYFIWTVVK